MVVILKYLGFLVLLSKLDFDEKVNRKDVKLTGIVVSY